MPHVSVFSVAELPTGAVQRKGREVVSDLWWRYWLIRSFCLLAVCSLYVALPLPAALCASSRCGSAGGSTQPAQL